MIRKKLFFLTFIFIINCCFITYSTFASTDKEVKVDEKDSSVIVPADESFEADQYLHNILKDHTSAQEKKENKKTQKKQKKGKLFDFGKYFKERIEKTKLSATHVIGGLFVILAGYFALNRTSNKVSEPSTTPPHNTTYQDTPIVHDPAIIHLPTSHDNIFLGEMPQDLEIFLDQLNNPQSYLPFNLPLQQLWRIEGGNGSGKTLLVHTFAQRAGIPARIIHASELISNIHSNKSILFRHYFEDIQKKAEQHSCKRGLLIIEDIDRLDNTIENELLHAIEQQCSAEDKKSTIFVILTGKKPEMDHSRGDKRSLLYTTGRFKVVRIPKPNKSVRTLLIEKLLQRHHGNKNNENIDHESLVTVTSGMLPAEIIETFEQSSADAGFKKHTTISHELLIQNAQIIKQKNAESEKYRASVPPEKLTEYIGKIPDGVLYCIDQLRNPQRYKEQNIPEPKGILLDGEPGTGKSLLAKVIAGELNIPLINTSAAKLSGKYINQGVEELEELVTEAIAAGKDSDSRSVIIFLDEIDSIGNKRKESSETVGNEEQAKTLNHLLHIMDGSARNKDGVHIIYLAATNNRKILDPALTRPGRFDKIIKMKVPDQEDYLVHVRFHMAKTTCDESVNFEEIAQKCYAQKFSQAEIAGISRNAAVHAVYEHKDKVEVTHIEKAIDDMKQRKKDNAPGYDLKRLG